MHILVTGGAGYIGSHTVDLMIRQGYSVLVFDNLSTGHREAVHPDARFVKGDLLDKAQVAHLFDTYPIEGILHFASYALVGESMRLPWLYMGDNVNAAANLLQAATAHNVKRFILSSTCNLFGNNPQLPIAPSAQPDPASPYGESKLAIERQLYWMSQIYGLTYCCLRYFNAAGAHVDGHLGEDHTPESHLIPLVIETAMNVREKLTVFGTDYPTPDGTCIRDYVHVMDLAAAHVLAYEAIKDGRNRTYNLGSGKGHSIMEVVEMVKAVSGCPVAVEYGPRRPGDPPALYADRTVVGQELGWQPQHSDLRAIIETAWRWHTTHPQGYRTEGK
jgi:UDP-glucose 4-epimerase